MSFAKAVDLLRLAMMATSRQGVCLSDVEAEFGGVRRTAQRMIAALEEAFPATEHYVGDDGRHYWRLPSRAVAPLLSPSAEELVSLRSAISELERVDMNGEANQLRSFERKVRALIPSDRTLRLATDEEAQPRQTRRPSRYSNIAPQRQPLSLPNPPLRHRVRWIGGQARQRPRSAKQSTWRMFERQSSDTVFLKAYCRH